MTVSVKCCVSKFLLLLLLLVLLVVLVLVVFLVLVVAVELVVVVVIQNLYHDFATLSIGFRRVSNS